MVPKSAKKDPGSAPKSQNDTHGAKLRPRVRFRCEKGGRATEKYFILELKLVPKSIKKALEAKKRRFIVI